MKTAQRRLLLLALATTLTAAAAPKDWTQWRGPTRDGLIEQTAQWPTRLDEAHLKQVWRLPLGPSYSGPLITGNRVITTETVAEESERVSVYDRVTGKLIWDCSWPGALKVPFFAAKNGSWIRSTPATDGERLFIMGIRDVLVALDLNNGEELWRYDFAAELGSPLPSFGGVCSPLLDGAYVCVQAGSGFCKLDKKSGKLVWRVAEDKGGMFGSAFSSPIKTRIHGKDLYLVQAREALHGIAAETGDIEFSQPVKAFRGMNIQTPVVVGNRIFTSSYGGRSLMFQTKLVKNSIQLEEAWNSKHQGYMTSPIVIDGVIYNHLRNQRLVALNAADGLDLWDVSNRFGQYLSLVTNGRQILALDQKGELFLFNASREGFRKLDSRKVGDNTWAHVAVAGDTVAIRELNALAIYRWTETKTAALPIDPS